MEPYLANDKKEATGSVLMATVRRDIRVQNRPAGIIRSIDTDKARDEKDNSVIGCQRIEEHH